LIRGTKKEEFLPFPQRKKKEDDEHLTKRGGKVHHASRRTKRGKAINTLEGKEGNYNAKGSLKDLERSKKNT